MCDYSQITLIPECLNVSLTFDTDAPQTKFVNISFSVYENNRLINYQISAYLRCWAGHLLNSMGTELVSVAADGTVTSIDTVSGTDLARLNYSFDYLSVNADDKLYLYDGVNLVQVVDADLGDCVDHIFVDGCRV